MACHLIGDGTCQRIFTPFESTGGYERNCVL